jgi:hypothetical protein
MGKPSRKPRTQPHKNETPITIAIEAYYTAIGLSAGWRIQRANRLAQWLGCTLHELGALCCVDFETMNRCIGFRCFPPHISLHFAMLEAWYVEKVKGRPTSPLMPVDFLNLKGGNDVG